MRAVAIACVALCATGCMWDGWQRAPDPALARMIDQPRVDPYEETTAFADGVALRAPPEGSVPYRIARAEPSIDRALALRGRTRFEIHCAPCHGMAGDGDSVIAEDMALRAPPSLLTGEIRAQSDQELETTIAEGFGLMPSYAYALPQADRRAVVLYVRALQLRDRVPVATLPEVLRRELDEATR